MPTHRSPNCPQIAFAEAAIKGRKVYEKEHTHPAPKAAVAEDLGYSGINGRALSIIGALRQYGILEGSSEALRVTEDAVTYFELEDGDERNAALHRMLFAPQLFQSLLQQFGQALPSESTLKHHLIKAGFLPRAADEVIGVYRENLSLVKDLPKRYIEGVEPTEEPPVLNPAIITPPAAGDTFQRARIPATTMSISFPLSMETKADLVIHGVLKEGDLEMLRDQIEMTIRALKRSQEARAAMLAKDEGQ